MNTKDTTPRTHFEQIKNGNERKYPDIQFQEVLIQRVKFGIIRASLISIVEF